ncbi:LOW QUALITY PROTEIN: Integrase, catalytic core protein [Phytophthora megakarya]|uniref:Integrase, catalytic core protein n=1 Tax=Phytophthora megakarya TaxID=4795 RepID=A0A225X414_9STRA|nr:LOW QUALITY PROTEIN: Integrase, catalytic core protein [Phytophthora megakarya]
MINEAWLENHHQTKIRSDVRAIEAWVALCNIIAPRSTTVGAADGQTLGCGHELVVRIQTLGEPVDEAVHAVRVRTDSVGRGEHENITQIEFKENVLKEHDSLHKKKPTEKAFRENGNPGRRLGKRSKGQKRNGSFKGKCFECDQIGRMKRDCPVKKSDAGGDAVVAVGEECLTGWLIDSGVTSHMAPFREDLFAFEGMVSSIEVTITDGNKLRVASGKRTVKLTGVNGKRIKMMKVLYIPGLDKSCCGKLGTRPDRGVPALLVRDLGNTSVIRTGTEVGKAYVLKCEQEEARFVEYTRVDAQWELWHARMGHPNKTR